MLKGAKVSTSEAKLSAYCILQPRLLRFLEVDCGSWRLSSSDGSVLSRQSIVNSLTRPADVDIKKEL